MKEVKDIVTQNETVARFSEFIGKDSFSSLASCATIIGVLVQAVKGITPIHPLVLSFIFSTILSGIKIVLSGDYSKDNVMLGIINIIPMALTASGGYDVISKISE